MLFTALFSLKLKWVVLVIIGLALSGSNMVGYLRCRMGSSVSGAANKYLQVVSMIIIIRYIYSSVMYLQQRVMANMMNMFKSNPTPPAQAQTA